MRPQAVPLTADGDVGMPVEGKEMATVNQQLHRSKTHAKGFDGACPICIRSRQLSEKLDQHAQIG
jgi:hypothetical protein